MLATSGVTIERLHEKVAYARADLLPLCMNTSTVRFKANKKVLVENYLYFFLQSESFKKQIGRQATGSAQLNFGPSHLKKVTLPVPPSPTEQRAIAAALSDVDGLLAKLDAHIAKKRDLKQAAMQQLLTGRTRLPGFSGEWEVKRLGDVGTFSKGKGIRKDEVVADGIPCIRYGEIYTHHNDRVKTFYSYITRATAKQSQRIKKGDLLFAGSGETAEEIGKCVAFFDDREGYAGGDIVVFSPNRQNSMFLGYLMNYPAVASQKARMGQGDAVVHISAKNLTQLELSLPKFDEQTAIAAVLSDMDAEIAALEARRDKTRVLKQGMMQELLTGRIRLVQPEMKPEDAMPTHDQSKKAANDGRNWAFNEAVIISVLVENFADASHPLGRMRYTKLSYLLHRYANEDTEGYLKKAAGPYNPATRYKGPERIAQTSGYVKAAKAGNLHGFVAGEQTYKACIYFDKWYGPTALEWLKQFRYEKNEALELLTTVDKAVEELRSVGKEVTVQSVKEVLLGEPEWKPKLGRLVFSDEHIQAAILRCQRLFGAG